LSAFEELRASAIREGRHGPGPTGEVRLCCPWCRDRTGKPDRKFALSANAANGFYYCFKCTAKGRADLSWLGQAASVIAQTRQDRQDESGRAPRGFVPFSEALGSRLADPYMRYAKRRGVLEAAVACGAGYCDEGFFAGRVVVPVVHDSGTWAGFVARTIREGVEPAYLYPRGMKRSTVLFNQAVLAPSPEPVFVVEGVMDALWLWPDAVALLGKACSTEQAERLVKARRPVVVALDGDAWREGMALALRLRALGARATWLELPPMKDPDDIPVHQLRIGAQVALKEVAR
jgi:hypothetical protein